MAEQKLILLDTHALIHRAFHAIRAPMNAPDGTPTNALYGFISMFLRLVSEQQPTHLIACTDMRGATFRHEQYAEYKATRPKTDPALHEQVPLVMQFLDAWCVPTFGIAGWEADDLLGTLARQAEARSIDTAIFTGDRDMTQLISAHISVWTPLNGGDLKKWGAAEVQDYFHVRPDQIIDFKALAGDSSDNIPGVTGIGPKGASDLLAEFDTLENIYQNLENVTGAAQQKLAGNREQAFLSQDLARIRCDAPIQLKMEKSDAECDPEQVDRFFADMNMRTLRKRFAAMKGLELPAGITAKKAPKKKVSEEQMSLF